MSSLRSEDQRVPKARRLRRDATDAERKLWLRLRRLRVGGSHFRRQATIGPYFADYACHAKRLIVELDGGQHGEELHAMRDAKRDAYMRSQGYRILRFWNNDVMRNIDGVLDVIAKAASAPLPPTPDPSPPLRGGRGSRTAEA
jgi:very-short-patch-repair endonuclease